MFSLPFRFIFAHTTSILYIFVYAGTHRIAVRIAVHLHRHRRWRFYVYAWMFFWAAITQRCGFILSLFLTRPNYCLESNYTWAVWCTNFVHDWAIQTKTNSLVCIHWRCGSRTLQIDDKSMMIAQIWLTLRHFHLAVTR